MGKGNHQMKPVNIHSNKIFILILFFIFICIGCNKGRKITQKISATSVPVRKQNKTDSYLQNADEFEKDFERKINEWNITLEVISKVITFKQKKISKVWAEAWNVYPRFVLTCMKKGSDRKVRFQDQIPVYSLNDRMHIETMLSPSLIIPVVSIQSYSDADIYFLQEQIGAGIVLKPLEIEKRFKSYENDGSSLPVFVRIHDGIGIIKSKELHCPNNTERYIVFSSVQNEKTKNYRFELEKAFVKQMSLEIGIPENQMRYLFDNANKYSILKETKPKNSSNSNQLARMAFAIASDHLGLSYYNHTASIAHQGDRWCLAMNPTEPILDGGNFVTIDKGEVISVQRGNQISPIDTCRGKFLWNEKGE